jgi:hypothetical protein
MSIELDATGVQGMAAIKRRLYMVEMEAKIHEDEVRVAETNLSSTKMKIKGIAEFLEYLEDVPDSQKDSTADRIRNWTARDDADLLESLQDQPDEQKKWVTERIRNWTASNTHRAMPLPVVSADTNVPVVRLEKADRKKRARRF